MVMNPFENLRTIDDFRRADEEFQLRKQAVENQKQQALRVSQGTPPAALQLANEYQKRVEAGDQQGANLLAQFAKTVDRGVEMGATGYQPMAGYGEAIGSIGQQKKSMERQGEKSVDLEMNPQIEAATTGAKISAEDRAKAAVNLPKAESQAGEALKLIQSIGNDPGLSAVIGAPNPLQGRIPFVGNIVGTPAADFQAKLDQLGGKQFLEAFESLKGAGQITEVEGAKATNAIGRMQTSQSEPAFRAALEELEGVIASGVKRNRTKAGLNPAVSPNETYNDMPIDQAPPIVQGKGNITVSPKAGALEVDKKRGEAGFQLRKKGFTQEQIDEYLSAKGL